MDCKTGCEHVRHVCVKGKWTCKACGTRIPSPKHVDWTSGRAPHVFMRGGVARMDTSFFTPSKGDVKPHFSGSLGCHVTSRADMIEQGKRRGLRPITPDEIGKPEDAIADAQKCKERAREAVRNPKRSLAQAHYERCGELPPEKFT